MLQSTEAFHASRRYILFIIFVPDSEICKNQFNSGLGIGRAVIRNRDVLMRAVLFYGSDFFRYYVVHT